MSKTLDRNKNNLLGTDCFLEWVNSHKWTAFLKLVSKYLCRRTAKKQFNSHRAVLKDEILVL